MRAQGGEPAAKEAGEGLGAFQMQEMGHGLMLAFGAFEDDETESDAASAAIAREVCDTLAAHGVEAKWEGSVNSRIEIAPFPWRKRRWTVAP